MSTALPEERATQPLYLSGNVARWLLAILPGLALTSAVAAASYGLRAIPGLTILSPMILSIFLGIFIRNTVGTPVIAKAGIAFSLRRVLRFAIILLGLQLTAAQAAEVGATGLAVIVTGLIATFLFTKWLGHMIGVERKLAELIAAGTSICGASAVVATNTVTDAPDEDVAYAVACVTVFGSIAMFVYPLLPGVLHLSEHAFGLWAGASIHEIAQVVAAAYQDGSRAGDFATIAKLSRVMMLAPIVIALGLVARRKNSTGEGGAARVPLPLFVLGFIALAGINSIIPIPAAVKLPTAAVTTFLLSVALAAMGLETDIAKLRMKGLRPFFLGLAAFLFISVFSLMLVSLTT